MVKQNMYDSGGQQKPPALLPTPSSAAPVLPTPVTTMSNNNQQQSFLNAHHLANRRERDGVDYEVDTASTASEGEDLGDTSNVKIGYQIPAISDDDEYEDIDELKSISDNDENWPEQEIDQSVRIPAELRDDTTVGQEQEGYLMANQDYGPKQSQSNSNNNNNSSKPVLQGHVDLPNQIDPINGKLVAKFRIKRLFKRIITHSAHQQHNLRKAMEILRGTYTGILLAKNEEVMAARAKKKINETPKPIQPMVSAALRYLMRRARFLIGTREPQKKGFPKPVTNCGAFFVAKSNGKLRVILDGRYANVYFKSNETAFSFFRLETLRNVIGNLAKNDKWYALNYDLRHWFHQIPLPKNYCAYLGMILKDRDKMRKKNRNQKAFYAFPRSLPMGFIQAPYLAQCCTWGIVLTTEKGRNWKGSDLDQSYLKRMENHGGPLPWVPLKQGGGIFVFLDNILVVTPDRAVAEWWEDKILRDCVGLHAWLKGSENHKPEGTVAEQRQQLADCFIELSKNPIKDPTHPDHFDFLGVRWSHHGRQVVLKSDAERGAMPGVTGNNLWKGSRRSMAGILGKILWYRRVHDISYFDSKHRDETDAILAVYRKLSPPPDAPLSAWDEPFTDFTAEQIRHLQKAWEDRADEKVTVASPLHTIGKDPSIITFAITDAATDAISSNKEDTEALAAGCWYWPGTDCIMPRMDVSMEVRKKRLPELETLLRQSVKQKFNENDGIAVGEMEAIYITIKAALQDRPQTRMLVLATDNMSCKYWIEKGHARNVKIQELLVKIHDELQKCGSRLFVSYVKTDDNFADQLSRNRSPEVARIQPCHELLLRALDEATVSLWDISGATAGGATRN